jgi:hypothetical protein
MSELSKIKVKVSRRSVSIYQYIRTDKMLGRAVVVRQDDDWNEAWAKVKPESVFAVDYESFCTEKDIRTNKKELAAFFAHLAYETRSGFDDNEYKDGLMLIHERDTSNSYIISHAIYPPTLGKKYYGRGPIQLSYNGNYGMASSFIFGDKNVLLKNPELVETDPVVAFKTAIWFWMTPETEKPSAHDVIIGKWHPNADDSAKGRKPGFGMTINIINGDVECNKGNDDIRMLNRMGFYKHYLKQFGVSDPFCACSCAGMLPYKY